MHIITEKNCLSLKNILNITGFILSEISHQYFLKHTNVITNILVDFGQFLFKNFLNLNLILF